MTSQEAVLKVSEYVKRTGKPAIEAVRELWLELTPIVDSDDLVQRSLAALVSMSYRRPDYAAALEVSVPEKRANGSVTVKHEVAKPQSYYVEVTVLHTVHYNVNGVVKSVAAMNRHDLLTLSRNAQRMAEGWTHYEQFFVHAAERLAKFKKATINDLGEGEQSRLSKMLYDVQQSRLPSDFTLPA